MDKPAQRVSDEPMATTPDHIDVVRHHVRISDALGPFWRGMMLGALSAIDVQRATIAEQAAEIERLKDEMTEATEKIRDDLDERFYAVEAQLKAEIEWWRERLYAIARPESFGGVGPADELKLRIDYAKWALHEADAALAAKENADG